MKIIGLIGGISWVSTIEYYRIINEEVNKRLGGIHSAKCIIYSVDLGELKEYQERGDWDSVAKILANAAKSLEKAGADVILICANTMHKVADIIEGEVKVPIIHIADATAEKIKERGLTSVGLLGTKFTMEEDFYKERLRRHGIEVLVPDKKEREIVNSIIYDELVKGIIRDESKQKLINIINRLADRGAQGVILGCTELPLLAKEDDVKIPIFDTTKIHAISAVEFIFKNKG